MKEKSAIKAEQKANADAILAAILKESIKENLTASEIIFFSDSKLSFEGTNSANFGASFIVFWMISGRISEFVNWVNNSTEKFERKKDPITATAKTPAVLDMLLFTPDAVPVFCGSTEFITLVVKGATVKPIPVPAISMAGKKLVQ